MSHNIQCYYPALCIFNHVGAQQAVPYNEEGREGHVDEM